ncbi:MAG: FAD-binding protein [Bacillota bacterium]
MNSIYERFMHAARKYTIRSTAVYDIAIVGAGPAGATLARLAAKDYRVLIIDKRLLSGPSSEGCASKCCGGLLAPDAQKTMAGMGLSLPPSVLVGPQIFAVRTIDFDNRIERYYQRFYINMDRGIFDRWLVSLIPDTAEIRCGFLFKSAKRSGGGFEITLSDGDRTYVEKASLLIGADGAASTVRKRLFPSLPFPKSYAAIQEWFPVSEATPFYSSIFDRDISDFYSWTIPKEGFLIIGAALDPGNTALSKFALLKQKLKEYGYVFGEPARREGAYIFRPVRSDQICTGKEGIALLGEAAGWISPTSSEGLSYAFRSALAASEALRHGPDDFSRNYESNTRFLRQNIFLKNIKSSFMYNRFLRKMVLRSGIASIQIQQSR